VCPLWPVRRCPPAAVPPLPTFPPHTTPSTPAGTSLPRSTTLKAGLQSCRGGRWVLWERGGGANPKGQVHSLTLQRAQHSFVQRSHFPMDAGKNWRAPHIQRACVCSAVARLLCVLWARGRGAVHPPPEASCPQVMPRSVQLDRLHQTHSTVTLDRAGVSRQPYHSPLVCYTKAWLQVACCMGWQGGCAPSCSLSPPGPSISLWQRHS
jgi:hypothetical protein